MSTSTDPLVFLILPVAYRGRERERERYIYIYIYSYIPLDPTYPQFPFSVPFDSPLLGYIYIYI